MSLANDMVIEELRSEHFTELTKALQKFKAKKMEKLFNLLRNGGRIISSAHCTEYQIAQAQACGRMYIDKDGFGFVYFP